MTAQQARDIIKENSFLIPEHPELDILITQINNTIKQKAAFKGSSLYQGVNENHAALLKEYFESKNFSVEIEQSLMEKSLQIKVLLIKW